LALDSTVSPIEGSSDRSSERAWCAEHDDAPDGIDSLADPSFLLPQDPGNFPAHFSLQFARAYKRDPSLEHVSPMDEVKTLTLTQSSLPLFQLWGGRLQLDAFQSTLHSQNAQLGPSGYGGIEGFRPTRQSYPGGPLSVHFSGFSLSFHFGRDSRAKHPPQVWRRMTQFVGTVRN